MSEETEVNNTSETKEENGDSLASDSKEEMSGCEELTVEDLKEEITTECEETIDEDLQEDTAFEYEDPNPDDLVAEAASACSLVSQKSLPNENDYVLHLALSSLRGSNLASASSSNLINVYSTETFAEKAVLKGHRKEITGIKFSPVNPNLLYSSSRDGNVRIWDLRKHSIPATTLADTTDGKLKPLTSFDFNIEEKFLCAGTDVFMDESYLLFWDLRRSQFLGGYWNSHSDEITYVKFHSDISERMITAGLDGLVNVFDLNEYTEDDALLYTLNCNRPVNKVTWLPPVNKHDRVSCITTDEIVQIYSLEEGSSLLEYERKHFLGPYPQDSSPVHHIVNSFVATDSIYTVTSSPRGLSLVWNMIEEKPELTAVLGGAHSDLVRAACHGHKNKIFTGGDDGKICIWKCEGIEDNSDTSTTKPLKSSSSVKERTTSSNKHAKPYDR